MGKLYIIPTPIGNLEDITFRAIRILNEVDIILAEDTRKTGSLLKHYDIKSKLKSYHKFNEHKITETIVQRIKEGEVMALVSDAGTPSISDPGYLIVKACIDKEIKVECLPGATAFVPALVNSGLPSDRFCFEGFLPQKKGREKKLLSLKFEPRTIILYESPHRLIKTLNQLSDHFGSSRLISVSREISKLHEEIVNGDIKFVTDHFSEKPIKGEIVIVVEGYSEKKKNMV